MADPQHPDIAAPTLAQMPALIAKHDEFAALAAEHGHEEMAALHAVTAAALRAARAAAIEEAARVAEEKYADPGWNGMIRGAAESIAAAIRSLGEESAAPPDEATS